MVCGACKQFGGAGMPLSYVNPVYREPSAYAGSDRVFSEPLLARPSLQHTGGRRSRKMRKMRKTRRRGGFYPSVMSKLIQNGARLVPVAAVTGYRMVKNYKKTHKRKHRK
jgi:hypothetical protein